MKFQKLTRGGKPYRIYAINCGGLWPIHGAIEIYSDIWKSASWGTDGMLNGGGQLPNKDDLIPEKKRRFKTADELIASNYSDISFSCYGVVNVRHMGYYLTKTRSDTPEGNYPEKWLDVFTCFEEDI